LVNVFFFLELAFFRGTYGYNTYGPDPLLPGDHPDNIPDAESDDDFEEYAE
jgi:hypothetical protein